MASYHFAVQVLKRSEGANTLAAAAYRSRTQLPDERAGTLTKNYADKGGFQRSEILLPEGAAPWLADRAKLWNHVEAIEKRRDAQLAREINVALPHELTDAERFEMTRAFVREHFVAQGMVADIAWHEPVREGGDDPRNFHAHIMLTLRQATPEGLRAVKTRAWNSKEMVEAWRAAWAAHQNAWLAARGHRARVDHRTLEAQKADAQARGDHRAAARLDRTPEIHVGAKARRMAAAGRVPPSQAKEQGLARQPRRAGRLEKAPALDPWARHAPGMNDRPERLFWKKRQRPRRLPAGEGRVLDFEEMGHAVRVVDYREIDNGSRVDYLARLVADNSQLIARKAVKLERQMGRLQRKLSYWERQATFTIEGALGGSFFRWQRARKAEEERAAREREREKKAHAAKRAQQVRALIGEIQLVFVAARGGREAVLARQRTLGDWTRPTGRAAGRGDRSEGRTRLTP